MRVTVILLLYLFGIQEVVVGNVPAFPGAEGFGKYATGGRGGTVIKVTNLNDAGAGSLRKAIQATGPRMVIFTVSGTIELKSELRINNGDITIAGQSAPGDGICIKGYPFGINADNVIIRFLRFRLGDEQQVEGDAFGGRNTSNVIIDHCSVSWATDECASFYHNRDFTMQWCIIAEPLNESIHAKGAHGYVGIWGGERASFHHNLIANSHSRTPRFSGSQTTANTQDELVDFRNNVVYNWGSNSVYGGERGSYNMVANYYKAGPATSSSKRNRIVNPYEPFGRFFVQSNVIEGDLDVTTDNWQGVHANKMPVDLLAQAPFSVMDILNQTAEEAYVSVLSHAGASLRRDEVDKRIVAEVMAGKSSSGKNQDGIIDSQQEVGGWPVLQRKPAAMDTDGDGLPDQWEEKVGTDPFEPNVRRHLHPDYDDIEIYLNDLIAEKNELAQWLANFTQ